MAVTSRIFADERRVEASAARVWNLLTELSGWSEWNPVYVHAGGTLAVGAPLSLRIVLPGMRPTNAKAKVRIVEPQRRLVFDSSLVPGVLWASRSFGLTPLGEDACLLSGREIFEGLAAPLLARAVGSKVQDAVALTNRALQQTAELPQADVS